MATMIDRGPDVVAGSMVIEACNSVADTKLTESTVNPRDPSVMTELVGVKPVPRIVMVSFEPGGEVVGLTPVTVGAATALAITNSFDLGSPGIKFVAFETKPTIDPVKLSDGP